MPKLPGPLAYGAMILGAVREGESKSEKRPIILCGQPESVEPLRSRLLEGAAEGTRAVELFAMRRLEPDDRKALSRAEVVGYGGTVVSGLDDATRNDLKVVAKSGRPKLVLLEALELPNPAVTQASRVRGIHPDDVLGFERGDFPHEQAMRELADRTDMSATWLASQLPALRPYVVNAMIEEAARRNAKYAALIFIPGTDLPVLTATQMRLVLRIAAAHGQEISPDRALELLSVLGAAFGFRALAGSIVGAVPVAGWALQAAIAYTGTKALGRAAVEYFEHGAVADVSRVRAFAEGVRAEVEQRLAARR
jgi:uncharacterized protein (DUF697 family)